jgi:transcriptional regulator with XRE-family HTH domain
MDRGKLIKELREKKSISQKEASEHLGVLQQTLYKYENNIVTNIPSDVIEKMAVLYETTPAHIMGWQESVTPEEDARAKRLLEYFRQVSPDVQDAVELLLKSSQPNS